VSSALFAVAPVTMVVVVVVVMGVVVLDGIGEAPCRGRVACWVLCGLVDLSA
jgi:hypothetical protein